MSSCPSASRPPFRARLLLFHNHGASMEIRQILHGLSCLSPPTPCLSFVPIAIHPDHVLFFHSSLSPSPMAVSTLHLPPMPPFPSSTISTPTSARASVSTSLKPNLSISFPYSRLQGPLHLAISPAPPSPSPRTPTPSEREEGERDGGHRNTGPRDAAPLRSRHFLRPPVDPQWALSGLRRRSHTPAVAHRHFFQGGQFLARARSTPSSARATYLAHSATTEVDRALPPPSTSKVTVLPPHPLHPLSTSTLFSPVASIIQSSTTFSNLAANYEGEVERKERRRRKEKEGRKGKDDEKEEEEEEKEEEKKK